MLSFRRLRTFLREVRGLAAVEFALITPVMITMLFGMGELSLAVFCRSDISQIASTAPDLIAQGSTVASGDLTNAFNAGNTILYPYYTGSTDPTDSGSQKPSIRISSVIYDTTTRSTTVGKVAWSCVQNGNLGFQSGPANGPRAKNSTFALSQSLLSSGGSVLVAEVSYKYTSPTMQTINAALNYSDQFVTRPRMVGQLAAPSPAPGSCAT